MIFGMEEEHTEFADANATLGFVALVMAWNAADESERERFLNAVRKVQRMTPRRIARPGAVAGFGRPA